jgi:hypothetical protein
MNVRDGEIAAAAVTCRRGSSARVIGARWKLRRREQSEVKSRIRKLESDSNERALAPS